MNTVATNLRFSKDEYRDLKLLALAEGESVASLVRKAVSMYAKKKLTTERQISIAEELRKYAVRIDVSVLDLVREGRRFE